MSDMAPRLSLVAEFDDLVRNRAVLTAGIESGEFQVQLLKIKMYTSDN